MDTQLRKLERRWKENNTYEDCKAYANALKRSGVKSLEVTDGHPEDLLSQFWPEVTYRGMNCIDLIFKLDEHSTDVHGDYDYAQECFLGYIPPSKGSDPERDTKDYMIIGWDAETTELHECSYSCEEECDERDEDLFFGVAKIYTVSPNATHVHCNQTLAEPSGFYGHRSNSLLKVLKTRYPSMIGLRYD